MKFKKNLLAFLLAICVIVPAALCFVGCGAEPEKHQVNVLVSFDGGKNYYQANHYTDKGGYVYGIGEYAQGEEVTITVCPYEGWEFDGWRQNGTYATQSKSNSYRFEVGSSDITLKAMFKETDSATSNQNKKYRIDEIEMYAVENGTLKAKHVDLLSLILQDEEAEKDVAVYSTFAERVSENEYGKVGTRLIISNSATSTKILATETYPIEFYSAVNEGNEFEENVSKRIYFRYWYLADVNYHENGTGNVLSRYECSSGSYINIKATSASTQTITVCTDSTGGFKIMLKLHFQEI